MVGNSININKGEYKRKIMFIIKVEFFTGNL